MSRNGQHPILGLDNVPYHNVYTCVAEYILSMLESSKGQSQLPNGSPNTTTANKTITKPDQTVPTATLSNDLTATTTTPTTIQPKTLHV